MFPLGLPRCCQLRITEGAVTKPRWRKRSTVVSLAATTGANVNTIVNAERRLAFTIWCTTSSSQRSFLVPTKITSGCFCGNSNHTLSSHTTGRRNRFNTENNPRNETTNSNDNKSAHKAWLEQERAALLDDASFLTRSVYRNCVRSIRLIRWGNASDERDFQEREEAQMRDLSASIMDRQKDQRFSMISMLPPVDREDELRSRAEYYGQYAREMFAPNQPRQGVTGAPS